MSNIARPLSRRLKAASKPRPQGRRQRPNVELLEERQLLATVQWISTTGGNWDDAANWSTGQVPGTGDDVVIDVSGATPTITIDSTTQASVNSVECSDPLAIAGGSLSVAASSTISGGLAMTVGGSLTASGSGVTLSVTGTTTASDSSLYVENGATLNLPQLTTYAIPDPSYACSFEATGSGSVLNLQGLDSLGTLLSPLYVEVSGGAEVLMSSLPSIDTGNLADVSVDADGSGSQINLSGLTSFTGGQLEATNGATVILNASLTRLTGVTITVDANSTLPLSQWTSLIDDSLNMDGGSYVLSSLTDIDSSSLVVQYGGSLSLPGITSYSNPLAGTTFEADGAGSMLSLPALTSLNQLQSATSIDAQQGGQTLLPSLTSIDTSQSNQQVFVQSDGAGAEIDLSALTSFESTNVSVLTVMHGGTILDNKLTSLTGVGVTLDGTGTLLASQWTSLIDGSLNIDGGSYTLSNLTDIDSSSLVVQSGGSLTLPAVTSYSNPLAGATFEATGAGSVLSLPALTSLTQLQNGIYIDADEGGQTLLKSVTSIDTTQSNQQVFVRADGPGSEIDLSSATSFDSVNVSTLSVTDGATLLDGMLTVLNGVDVALDGTGALATTQWTAFTGATLNLNGGELGLPSLTSADNAGFLVSGTATLTLSAASDFANSGASATLSDTAALDVGTADVTMPAPGDGATFNIPQMPEGLTIVLSPDGTYSGGTTIDASAGDSIVVANCTFTGGVVFNVGNGTTLDLPGASITGGATFNVDTGATVDLTVGETSTISGAFGGAGAGTVILNSGTLAIGIGGATFNFPGSMFQWTGGTIDGALGVLTNTNLGTINLAGPNAKGLARDGTLDDFGTIIQTGGGYLAMHSDDRAPAVVEIERGGSYLIESDAGVEISGESEIDNAGTIQKTAGTGASALTVDGTLNNTGTIEADSGTLYLDTNTITEVSANALTGGTWKAEGLANLAFPPGTAITSSAADISLDGAGATITGIAGLSSNSGSLSITNGATFTTTADFSNGGTLNVGAGSTLTVNGAFTQTSKGALDVQIGGTPASGLSGQVAVSGTATLAGAFNLAVVNDFAPSAGEDFKVMTFASASGNFTTFTGLNPFFTESLGATSLDLIDNATSAVDLAGLTVTAPITATAGQAIAVSWQATDASSQAATGSWQDSVYVSATPAITATSILLGATQHTGGLAGDGTYNSSLTAPLPALAPGNYYVLVQIDSLYQVPDPNRANNTLAAGTGELAVRLPALTLGIATQGTFAAAGQHDYYQVTVPAGGSLVVSLASTASSGAVALYVSQGTEPTPYNYQEAADVANQPDQTVTVPQVAAATTYYILAESVAGAAAMGGYSLIATQTGAVSVAAISSYSGGNAGNVTVKIDGTNFSRNTTASLSLGGAPINSASIYYQNASQIFATFDLTGAAVGSYTLNVQVGPNSATAPTKFNVVPASTGEPLSLVLSPPALVSAGRDSVVDVTATNTSNNDILAPLLQLTTDGATLKLPSQTTFQGSTLYFLGTSPTGPAGTMTPGESVQVEIQFQSTTTNPTINFQLNEADDSQPMDWASQEQALQIPTIPDAAWPIVFANFENAMGTTVAEYHAVLAADATYLAQLGEPTNDVLQLVEFEIEKANAAYTAQTLVTVTPDDLPAPGMDLTFQQSYLASIGGRYYQGILGALGWTTNWDTTATTTSTGDVAIQFSGSYFYFFLQTDGSYQPEAGDEGEVLTLTSGAYRLLEPDGTVYQFNTNQPNMSASLDYVQDTNGNRITASYNADGQLSRLTDTNGEYLQLGYNSQGQMTTLTDSNGQQETYRYTGQFLTTYQDIYGTTTYTYVSGGTAAQNGSLDEIAYADNTHIYFTYDTEGRLVDQHRDGGAEDEKFSYLTPGGLVTTDGDNISTTSYFDLYGATAETIDALGNVTLINYDANLNLVQVVAPGGLTSSYTYDVNGNLTSETDPLGYTTSFTYNSSSDLTSYTDAKGNTTSYAYDSNQNLLSINYANGTSQQYNNYNPLGEAMQFVNANGDAIGYQYNADGLVTQENFADGTSYSYTYNAQGNLTSATDAQGNVTKFIYGETSNPTLLTEVDYPDGTWLKFTYNIVGQRTQSVDQTGFTVNYQYDAVGRLEELTDGSGNLMVQYIYDNAGNLLQKNNGNGTFTVYTYDMDERVASITNYAPSTGSTPDEPANSAVNSFDKYTYDALGNVATDTSQDGEWFYTYDADSQLVHAVFTPNATDPDGLTAQNLQYVYDAAGNRTSETVNGVVTTYVVNNMNEYTSSTTAGVGTTTYQYDNDGNLTSVAAPGGTTTYTFNESNELSQVSGPGLTASYAYNPLGEQISQTVNGTTTNFQIDPAGLGNVVAAFSGSGVYNNSGGLTAHYTYGPGLVSQVAPGNVASYYDFGITGSTIGITGPAGTYLNKYAYLPFGQTSSVVTGLQNSFTFAGQSGVRSDVSGLFSMRVRVYNPTNGQFDSSDPLGLGAGETNLREYAANDPLCFVDPSGLCYVNFSLSGGFGVGGGISVLVDQDGYIWLQPGAGLTTPGINALATYSPGTLYNAFGSQLAVAAGFGPGVGGEISVDQWTLASLWGEPNHGANYEAGVGYAVGINASLFGTATFRTPFKAPNGFRAPCTCKCPPGLPPAPPSTKGPNGTTPNETANDPNALIGPSGFSTQGFIAPSGNWSYTVEFANDGTAPALDVIATEQLDPSLNWSTFELGSFGFGPINVTIPAGMTEYQNTVTYQNTDGSSLNVQVALDFNVQTGLLTVTFTSLDPSTGEAPTGVFDGFLPPNNSSGAGEGSVQYTVQPQAGLATGTQIRGVAQITFDTNPPIPTDLVDDNDPSKGIDPNKQALVTIDASPPASTVAALPATTTTTSFTVSWSGSDGQGPGIASYNVYVADNGGAFAPWLTDTSQTSAAFTGQFGSAYAFYSVATDNVGLVQPTPSGAQASTFLAAPPTSTVRPLPATTTSKTFTVSWTGSPGQGSTSIASYEIFVSEDGGKYTPFLTSTTHTSASFTGAYGHTYAFFSVATDNFGSVQPTPTTAQATTKVVLPPLVNLKQVQDITNSKHQVTEVLLTFSGPVNSTEADQTGTYHLDTPGKGGSYTARNAGIIKLNSAVYTVAKDTVALTPAKPFALTKPVQLLIYGAGTTGLKDTYGRYIDGDHNGVAGGNAIAILSKAGANIDAVPLNRPTGPAARLAAVDAVIERENPALRRTRSPARSLRTK